MLRWLQSLLGRRGDDGYVVVYAAVPDGLSADAALRMRDLYNRIDPEGWWFINPGSFVALFSLGASGRERASQLVAEIKKLKAEEPELAEIRLGRAEGSLPSVETRADGKILSLPRGKLLNDAAHSAVASNVEA
jgi:hypothetical protein